LSIGLLIKHSPIPGTILTSLSIDLTDFNLNLLSGGLAITCRLVIRGILEDIIDGYFKMYLNNHSMPPTKFNTPILTEKGQKGGNVFTMDISNLLNPQPDSSSTSSSGSGSTDTKKGQEGKAIMSISNLLNPQPDSSSTSSSGSGSSQVKSQGNSQPTESLVSKTKLNPEGVPFLDNRLKEKYSSGS
jgi:hypothetical protein